MKKYTLLLSFFWICLQAYGQQDAQYTQFIFNKLVYNPAYAGSASHPSLMAVHRSQWVGLEGAPVSQVFNFHTPFKSKRVGVGLSLSHDKIGPSRSIFVALSYAYRIKLTKGVMSLGLQGAIRHYRIAWEDTKATHAGDDLIMDTEASKILPNAGVGIYYETNKFYIGISSPHIIKGDLSLLKNVNSTADFSAVENVHSYLMAGFIFPINDAVKFKPAVLLKYVKHAPFDMDINGSFLFLNKFWFGLTYRLGGSTVQGFGESIDIVAQYHINNSFKLGIAYDITLSEIQDYNNGSYEFLVQYDLQNGNRSKFTNPRFF